MEFEDRQRRVLRRLRLADGLNFSSLAKLADLDPLTDFIGSELQGVDFGDSVLDGFDFSDANLKGAKLDRAILGSVILDNAYIEDVIWPSTVRIVDTDNYEPEPIWRGGFLSFEELQKIILKQAILSPNHGLIALWSEVERKARKMAASSGHIGRDTVLEQLQIWAGQLPSDIVAIYLQLNNARNRVAHGVPIVSSEVLDAIDAGLVTYAALAAIPIEQNTVIDPGVEIFSDAFATKQLPGKGLIMETINMGIKSRRIYPTLMNHYTVGMRLTWEWSMENVWDQAWYRDPDGGQIVSAWGSSAEFVGRDLDAI